MDSRSGDNDLAGMNNNLIHVYLVEDDPELRSLMTLLLDGSPGFSCAKAVSHAETAIKEIPVFRPDLVLMDIHLPGQSGIEAVNTLRLHGYEGQILMLTVQEDDASVFDSLCAGASGYLLKDTPPAQLLEAIREASQGGAPMSPSIARKVIRSFQVPKVPSTLSTREMEVLSLLCNGENYRTIADKLFVSTNTVKAHIKKIYEKLHVHTRAEAVKKALKEGWI